MKKTILLVLLGTTLCACSSAPKPKTLNGRHRQPINQHFAPAPTPAPAVAVPAAVAPQIAHYTPTPATGVAEMQDSPAIEVERVYRVFFKYGSTDIRVSEQMTRELLELARNAKRIDVSGRTDGSAYSLADERVALGRAIAARAYLVQHGIDASRIKMDYISAADYLADNSSTAGRDRNRRVEIRLSFHEPSDTPNQSS